MVINIDIMINYMKIMWEEPEEHNHHARSMRYAMELKLLAFLITALNGDEWSGWHFGRRKSTPRETENYARLIVRRLVFR